MCIKRALTTSPVEKENFREVWLLDENVVKLLEPADHLALADRQRVHDTDIDVATKRRCKHILKIKVLLSNQRHSSSLLSGFARVSGHFRGLSTRGLQSDWAHSTHKVKRVWCSW